MEITEVKVFPIQEEKLKAFVSIVFDQCFMVNDIKIIQGRDGLFISMPSRKKKNGEFKDVAHPLNNETRRTIEEKVLAEYDRVPAGAGRAAGGPRRAGFAARRRRWPGRPAMPAEPDRAEEARTPSPPRHRRSRWKRSRSFTSATPSGPCKLAPPDGAENWGVAKR